MVPEVVSSDRCAAYARTSRHEAQDGLGIERQIDTIGTFAVEGGWTLDPDRQA